MITCKTRIHKKSRQNILFVCHVIDDRKALINHIEGVKNKLVSEGLLLQCSSEVEETYCKVSHCE